MRAPLAAPLALLLAACAGGTNDATPAAPPAAAGAPAPAETPAVPVTPATPAVPATPAAALPPTGTLPGDRIPAFAAKVRRADGESTLDMAAPKGTTVLVVMSTTCPYCSEAAEPLRRAEDAYRSRGVEFVYLYPMRSETTEEKIAWHGARGFAAAQVIDADAVASRALKADKTPTAYLVDSRGVLLYRGAVIEGGGGAGPARHPLADAIDEHLAGRPVSVSSVEPAG